MSAKTNKSFFEHLLTPTFLVDWEKTQKNAHKMIKKAEEQRVILRPHVKTHKTSEIAQIQTENEGKPITVSTIAEMLFYVEHGFYDVFLAVPITVQKMEYILSKIGQTQKLYFLTDSLEVCKELESFLQGSSNKIKLRIKLNVGQNRAGLSPESEALLSLATFIHKASHLEFDGLVSHGGQSYGFSDENEKKRIALHEITSMNHVAQKLEQMGIPVPTRSIGSTPTMSQSLDLKGITEIRPGNYIWYDQFQTNRGNCKQEEIACSVLTSIIGIYPERESILIDAGALALSKDPGFWDDGITRFGMVKNFPEMQLKSLSQEHGVIQVSKEVCEQFRVGEKLEILPNHSCLTAACFNEFVCYDSNGVLNTIKPAKFWV